MGVDRRETVKSLLLFLVGRRLWSVPGMAESLRKKPTFKTLIQDKVGARGQSGFRWLVLIGIHADLSGFVHEPPNPCFVVSVSWFVILF